MSDTHKTESLHDQIMRLPCTPPKDANVNQSISYKSGHRDARHAAAELAAEHEAEQQQELTAIEAMARMLADGEWAEHVGMLGGPIARRLETEITRLHNEQQAAPVAVPPAQQPVAVKSHGAWDGLELLAEQPDGTELYAAQPAQPTQADMNAAIDRMRRENNLSIDGDNAYKRDLLDCVIGALAFGKQGSTPPPEDHWLHRFWEIGDAERKERDAAPPAQQSQWVPKQAGKDAWRPISTAPRDGTEIILRKGERVTAGSWIEWSKSEAEYHSSTGAYLGHFETDCGASWGSWDGGFCKDDEPTHWMPLPAAPGDTAAPEQAEQPHPVNRSVIRDVFLRNGFTIKEGHDDLKPYVYAAAEELLALDGKAVAVEQDAVKVQRELLGRITRNGGVDTLLAIDELRALLGSGA